MSEFLAAAPTAANTIAEVADLGDLSLDEYAVVRDAARAARAVTASRRNEFAEHSERIAREYAQRWGAAGSDERGIVDEHVRAAPPEVTTIPPAVRARQLRARQVDRAVALARSRRASRQPVATRRRRRSPASTARTSDSDDDGESDEACSIEIGTAS